MRLGQLCVAVLLLFLFSVFCEGTFSPLSDLCQDTEAEVDSIDHCCLCRGCLGEDTLDGEIRRAERWNISPVSTPLPLETENIGTSLCISPDGKRVIFDNSPFNSELNNDQQLSSNTRVHILEIVTDSTTGDFQSIIHSSLSNVPPALGHVIAASNHFIAVGVPIPASGSPVIDLYVKTISPAWSKAVEIEDLGNDGRFGSALAIDEPNDVLVGSDTLYYSNLGRVWVFALSSPSPGYLLDTIDHPDADTYLTLSNPFTDWYFGTSVAVDGGTIVVGSPGDDTVSNDDLGRIHIYERYGDKWFYISSFYPQAGVNIDDRGFGWSVALQGDWIVVGSKNSDTVEVYLRTVQPVLDDPPDGDYEPSVWEFYQALTEDGLSISTTFGRSVAINVNDTESSSTSRIVIGDSTYVASYSGQGKVFTFELSTDLYDEYEWVNCQAFEDDPESFQTRFGQNVALNYRWLVVAAPDLDSSDNGNGDIYIMDLRREGICEGCDGEINSCVLPDACGVCNGDNSTCTGCDNVVNSGIVDDFCGVCDGDNTTCMYVSDYVYQITSDNIDEYYMGELVESDIYVIEDDSITFHVNCSSPLVLRFYYEPSNSPNTPVVWNFGFDEEALLSHNSSAGIQEFDVFHNGSIIFIYTTSTMTPDIDFPDRIDVFNITVTDSLGNSNNTITLTVIVDDCIGCDGNPNSATIEDACGVCDGDNSTCTDCNGVVNGDSFQDYCGVCMEDDLYANQTCLTVFDRGTGDDDSFSVRCKHTIEIGQVRWEPNYPDETIFWELVGSAPNYSSNAVVTINETTGIITYTSNGNTDLIDTITFQGTNSYDISATGQVNVTIIYCEVQGCDGILGSGNVLDLCGVCEGNNDCVDCLGVPFGSAELDDCGVCNGDNSSCEPLQAANQLSTTSIVLIAVAGGLAIIFIAGLSIGVFCMFCAAARPGLTGAGVGGGNTGYVNIASPIGNSYPNSQVRQRGRQIQLVIPGVRPVQLRDYSATRNGRWRE